MPRAFDNIIIVFHENQYGGMVLKNKFMRSLLDHGIYLSNYHGCYHPSQTNYLAAVAGQVCGVFDDEDVFPPLQQQTIVDMLDSTVGDLSWKAYMEDYPRVAWNADWCSDHPNPHLQPPTVTPGTPNPPYHSKHNPFVLFKSIQRSPDKWSRVVDYCEFAQDVESGNLPNYSWITPNIWNDGHYIRGTKDIGDDYSKLVDQSAEWLERNFLPKIGGVECSKLPPRTLVLITWDEAGFRRTEDRAFYDGHNQIYGVLLGPDVEPSIQTTPYNHYSLLRTIERNYDLPHLGGNDRGCNYFRFLWNEEFAWGTVEETGLGAGGGAALAPFGDQAALVTRDESGALFLSTLACGAESGGTWSNPEPLGLTACAAPALAEYDGSLMLVYPADGELGEGELMFSELRDLTEGWSEPASLGFRCRGTPVLSSYTDADSGNCQMMCVYRRAESRTMASLLYFAPGLSAAIKGDGVAGWDSTEPEWQARPTLLPFVVEGPIALGFLPETLILIGYDPRDEALRAVSYNTAPWNAVSSGYPDDTTQALWSPRSYAAMYYPGHDGRSQGAEFRTQGPLAMAPLGGELRLVHRAANSDAVQSTTYSLAGTMTSKHVYTNEFGTLGESAWGINKLIEGLSVSKDGVLIISQIGDQLMIVFQPAGSDTLNTCLGGWVKTS